MAASAIQNRNTMNSFININNNSEDFWIKIVKDDDVSSKTETYKWCNVSRIHPITMSFTKLQARVFNGVAVANVEHKILHRR